MSIIYNEQEKRFVIETKNTAYAMKVELDRYLVHVYYGERAENIPDKSVIPDRGFSAYPSDVCLTQPYGGRFSFNLRMLEFPGFDCGDYRSDAVRVKNADGKLRNVLYIYFSRNNRRQSRAEGASLRVG